MQTVKSFIEILREATQLPEIIFSKNGIDENSRGPYGAIAFLKRTPDITSYEYSVIPAGSKIRSNNKKLTNELIEALLEKLQNWIKRNTWHTKEAEFQSTQFKQNKEKINNGYVYGKKRAV